MPKYDFSQFKLKNNLTVLHLPVEQSESVVVTLMGKVGRRAENEQEVGAAHFLEHLFFDGTISRPTPLEINKYLEEYGGEHNGFTRSETVDYYVKILTGHTEAAFNFLSDIFLNSLLQEIEKERKIIGQEAAAKKDNPIDILERLSLSNLYPNQSIGRNIFDEESNLNNINGNLLKSYRDRTYIAENFILAISGNITLEEATKLSTQYFEQIKNGSEISFAPSHIRENQNLVITKKDFTQSKLTINFKGFPINSWEGTVAGLLSIILGGGFSSRLFEKLRNEQHIVYSVNSYLRKFSDSGYFVIRTFVDEVNVQKAADIIFEEIYKLLNGGITDGELEKGKNTLLSNFLFRLDDLYNYASYFSSQLLLTKKIKSINEVKTEINRISKDDVLKIGNQIFSDAPKINLLTKTLDNLIVKSWDTRPKY